MLKHPQKKGEKLAEKLKECKLRKIQKMSKKENSRYVKKNPEKILYAKKIGKNMKNLRKLKTAKILDPLLRDRQKFVNEREIIGTDRWALRGI